jgi:DNA-directed RNA polymerase subunit RPC12/RpoP
MSPMRPEKCPYCGGAKLTFAEQLSSVTVYQCEDCGRAVSVTRRPSETTTK